ncbi:glycosyltransferase [Sporichthya brevicatena]|uniref:glycosyltransferase n=1 Tax=Sporichthya brevicatena TaxID=171442 RepID=UPI0031D9F030
MTSAHLPSDSVLPVVDVVLPCLDEAAALPWVLERMPPWARAIVVDNGSTDDSAAVAAALGALVVSEPRRGFGAAAHAGLLAATADVVCFCDCDASMDPGQLERVTAPVLAGTADLVLGRRRPARGSWPVHARLANRALAVLMTRHSGVRLHDLGPMRAARRTELVDLDLRDRRFGYPLEMVLTAARADWRIEERDIDYRPRIGKSKVTGTLRGTVRTVRDMRAVLAT